MLSCLPGSRYNADLVMLNQKSGAPLRLKGAAPSNKLESSLNDSRCPLTAIISENEKRKDSERDHALDMPIGSTAAIDAASCVITDSSSGATASPAVLGLQVRRQPRRTVHHNSQDDDISLAAVAEAFKEEEGTPVSVPDWLCIRAMRAGNLLPMNA